MFHSLGYWNTWTTKYRDNNVAIKYLPSNIINFAALYAECKYASS